MKYELANRKELLLPLNDVTSIAALGTERPSRAAVGAVNKYNHLHYIPVVIIPRNSV
jgi:hypothetical protein